MGRLSATPGLQVEAVLGAPDERGERSWTWTLGDGEGALVVRFGDDDKVENAGVEPS